MTSLQTTAPIIGHLQPFLKEVLHSKIKIGGCPGKWREREYKKVDSLKKLSGYLQRPQRPPGFRERVYINEL